MVNRVLENVNNAERSPCIIISNKVQNWLFYKFVIIVLWKSIRYTDKKYVGQFCPLFNQTENDTIQWNIPVQNDRNDDT